MRIALGIEYNGHGYYGWQTQPDLPTIQGALQEALSKIANESIYLFCAGRTDANVHAMGQVVHFDTSAKRHIDAWVFGTNAYLPPSIVVHFARPVDYHFHARFKATSRRYRYVIFNHPVRPAVFVNKTTWYYYPLNIEHMDAAGRYLIGEQDFSSFRSAQCASASPIRYVYDFTIFRQGDLVIFEIEANAFLQHMVRNIAGVLMKIGAGLKPPLWMKEVIEAKDRRYAAETASPAGLYLVQVKYQEPYTFPLPRQLILL
ncbi:MAG: tRNA pseudouridine(38-40) synthase TruA [Gammaproteobacteria bacterium RIFCSPHIGHO2_12_FULL_38_14]|nr:MAG: tRNA pseudouridine(38-40) synthase TruA [Gammaproteobacteria bacterium RIFCSPHIGHO2_12_FULL_38_14]